jgi:hypothetical protein
LPIFVMTLSNIIVWWSPKLLRFWDDTPAVNATWDWGDRLPENEIQLNCKNQEQTAFYSIPIKYKIEFKNKLNQFCTYLSTNSYYQEEALHKISFNFNRSHSLPFVVKELYKVFDNQLL